MSKCNCGQANVPLGVTSVTAGGVTHGVTSCVSCWTERAEVIAPLEEVTLLRAQVQRVREVCEHPETTWRPHGLGLVRVENILRALEGDSNE